MNDCDTLLMKPYSCERDSNDSHTITMRKRRIIMHDGVRWLRCA